MTSETDASSRRSPAGPQAREGLAPMPLALIGVVFVIAILMRQVVPLNTDVSWLLVVGERMLDGQHLYRDIVEINPPMAAFAYLQSLWGPVWTPLAIGLANFALAALALLAAMIARPGPELAMAEALRKLSGSALESEFQAGLPGAGLLGALGGSGESNVARMLVPVAVSIISALRKA